jgi:hypothetical protein
MIPPFGHEKIAGSVIFLQEPDVRAHVRVDLAQALATFVDEPLADVTPFITMTLRRFTRRATLESYVRRSVAGVYVRCSP